MSEGRGRHGDMNRLAVQVLERPRRDLGLDLPSSCPEDLGIMLHKPSTMQPRSAGVPRGRARPHESDLGHRPGEVEWVPFGAGGRFDIRGFPELTSARAGGDDWLVLVGFSA